MPSRCLVCVWITPGKGRSKWDQPDSVPGSRIERNGATEALGAIRRNAGGAGRGLTRPGRMDRVSFLRDSQTRCQESNGIVADIEPPGKTMKTGASTLGLLALLSAFSSTIRAVPITYTFEGVVDQGKADFTGSLVDISGRNYVVSITGDTSYSDTDANLDGGRFQDFISQGGTTVIWIAGLGNVSFGNPDFLAKQDDGVTAVIGATFGGGLVGVINIGVPVGMFGDPNAMVPFGPLGIISGSIGIGESIPVQNDAPTEDVWFRDLDPITVSASVRAVSETGSTFSFAIIAALLGGLAGFFRKRNRAFAGR